MSSEQPIQSQSTVAIQSSALMAKPINWFEYLVRVQPHHTDYSGVVWHGSYITWLEEARVEYLRSLGVNFADLVAIGCDLPVVDLTIRYHRPLKMGMEALVKTRILDRSGVRIHWDYQIQSLDGAALYVTAQVTLVTIDREKGKVMRQLPPAVQDFLERATS